MLLAGFLSILFTNCIAWNGKARCFGICGEVVRDIRNVTFRDCAVIWRDATWDNDRVCSLAIIVEDGGGTVENITFENMEIYRDAGRAIGCIVYGDGVRDQVIRGVRYKNIRCVTKLKCKFDAGDASNQIAAEMENVEINGVQLARHKRAALELRGGVQLTVR